MPDTETKIPPCDHVGHRNPVAQNVLMGPSVLIVISHNCSNCGQVFITMKPLDLPEEPNTTASLSSKSQIIKPS
jgi:hypothetical protein